MALTIHCPTPFTAKLHRRFHAPVLLPRSTGHKLVINSQSQDSAAETDDSGEVAAASPKKSASPGLGFGSSSASPSKASSATVTSKRKQKGKRERVSIIRRSPVEKPAFISKEDESRAGEQSKNESAFLLAWLGLGGVILIEGIALAASGFLPEEWDKFFVKYLYPSFTPTVFLFVAGTVAYGVLKYLENEQIKDKK
ncbi:protein LOW PSII ACCUMULATION 2, chloroplastic [Punica granatum]|uniref:Uncharacterized protein n=2 Tax=Punica granatum TaxID=22663 RepID=A0A218X3X7_PUNGR|nr:protein LOW PSII ACCUMULATION 2, chloroplastic [Punica granatum]OWM79468.1 hypothetical protein CDL15_Pgr022880 [Punica granatum]PKI65772.1 hypothetical protein CRG98_013844 [Punica granatum]